MTLAFFNDVDNDAESTQKSTIAPYSLVRRVNKLCKPINRIPSSHLLISSLPGSASRTYVESLCKPGDVNKRSQSIAW